MHKAALRCDGDDGDDDEDNYDNGNGFDTMCNCGYDQIDIRPRKGRVTGLIPWPKHGPLCCWEEVLGKQRREFLKQEP